MLNTRRGIPIIDLQATMCHSCFAYNLCEHLNYQQEEDLIYVPKRERIAIHSWH